MESVWRADSASMLGVLVRRLGDLDRAEEALQDAVGEALRRWPADGLPASPSGWLVTTAWRRALDRLRHEAVAREKLAALASVPPPEPTPDDRLALIFACCHPGLPEHSQIALTLSAVAGLSAEEIAAAFLKAASQRTWIAKQARSLTGSFCACGAVHGRKISTV